MKEAWAKPVAEKVEFDYRDQVVAGTTGCEWILTWIPSEYGGTCSGGRITYNQPF